jgi:nitrite reductase/ring-hydroxylating ferredoxin subunit/uncharacterized membrane protein
MKAETLEHLPEVVESVINRWDCYLQISQDVAHYLHELVLEQGEDFRDVTDVLHGKQLGHPLHPVLTDLTIGSWSLGLLFDVLSILSGSRSTRNAGDKLIGIGTMLAVPTAVAGVLDYSTIKRDVASYGATHGLINGLAFSFFLMSTIARVNGNRTRAFLCAVAGAVFATVSAWLGGELVYRHRIGVNHAPEAGPLEWTTAMSVDELADSTPTYVEVGEKPVLLFRKYDEIYAIGAVCSHAGGPLEEGTVIDGNCIECPWHQSVFDLRDGHVVHSPATYGQPDYEVRVHNEKIQIRQMS